MPVLYSQPFFAGSMAAGIGPRGDDRVGEPHAPAWRVIRLRPGGRPKGSTVHASAMATRTRTTVHGVRRVLARCHVRPPRRHGDAQAVTGARRPARPGSPHVAMEPPVRNWYDNYSDYRTFCRSWTLNIFADFDNWYDNHLTVTRQVLHTAARRMSRGGRRRRCTRGCAGSSSGDSRRAAVPARAWPHLRFYRAARLNAVTGQCRSAIAL